MISLSEILHTIAQALMIPCLIILLILMAGAVWQIGDIVVEYIAERRKHKCNVPQLLRDVHAAGADGLAELIENSGLLRRQKKALLELAESRGLPKDTLTAIVTACGLEPTVRGERLGLAEYARLSDALLDAVQ